MTNESPLPGEPDSIPAESTAATPVPASFAWVSRLAVVLCIGVFAGLMVVNDYESLETLSKFGYLPAGAVWDGQYWALVTSVFVHFEPLHLAFNVYWLWVLGSRLERAIGSLPFLAFFLASAAVSSSFQLTVSGDTGIGASGVAYAIFGIMWLSRNRYAGFKEVLDKVTIVIFMLWLIGCIVVTALDYMYVGNAAHISGLLFGGAVAGSFVLHYKPRAMRAALSALVLLSIIPLIWNPWSVTWLSHHAYKSHVEGRYGAALYRYARIIRLDPDNAWAYINRSSLYTSLGENELATKDWQRAFKLDPAIVEQYADEWDDTP